MVCDKIKKNVYTSYKEPIYYVLYYLCLVHQVKSIVSSHLGVWSPQSYITYRIKIFINFKFSPIISRGLFNTLVIIVYINYLCSVLRSQILLLLYMYYDIIDTPLPLPPISSMAHKFLLRENNKTCCNLELVNLEFYIKIENVRLWQNRVHARHVIL